MDGTGITFQVNATLLDAARRMARDADISVGQLMRDLLAKEVSRRLNAKPPVRADEQLVAPLRARLALDLAGSSTWDDLQTRLKALGFVLREAGGGLALHDWPADRRLCKASELGFSYSRLMQRFAAPFPGHAHGWLADRFLGPSTPVPDPAPVDAGDMIESNWPRQQRF